MRCHLTHLLCKVPAAPPQLNISISIIYSHPRTLYFDLADLNILSSINSSRFTNCDPYSATTVVLNVASPSLAASRPICSGSQICLQCCAAEEETMVIPHVGGVATAGTDVECEVDRRTADAGRGGYSTMTEGSIPQMKRGSDDRAVYSYLSG